MFASERVLQSGSWHSLTIDDDAVAKLGGQPAAWRHGRLRPFSRLSPRLDSHLQAVVQSMRSAPMDVVLVDLRSLLAVVASELVEAETPGFCPPGLPSRAAERFKCFRSAIPGSVRVTELATETGLSRFQAMRAFKRRFGLPPAAYQLRVRPGRGAEVAA